MQNSHRGLLLLLLYTVAVNSLLSLHTNNIVCIVCWNAKLGAWPAISDDDDDRRTTMTTRPQTSPG